MTLCLLFLQDFGIGWRSNPVNYWDILHQIADLNLSVFTIF